MLDFLLGLFSHDLAIDLGTANILVGIREKGIVVREPSVVARHKKSKKILAVGTEAKKMLGKTPATIEALRPLRHGVISDFDATSAMLTIILNWSMSGPGHIYRISRAPKSSSVFPPASPKWSVGRSRKRPLMPVPGQLTSSRNPWQQRSAPVFR